MRPSTGHLLSVRVARARDLAQPPQSPLLAITPHRQYHAAGAVPTICGEPHTSSSESSPLKGKGLGEEGDPSIWTIMLERHWLLFPPVAGAPACHRIDRRRNSPGKTWNGGGPTWLDALAWSSAPSSSSSRRWARGTYLNESNGWEET